MEVVSMANLHYAEIGDVWKHLPLAEVLAIEAPRRYLESHSGSSSYLLTRSPQRDYGALRFASRAPRSPTLQGSAYLRLLARYNGDDETLATYPGSLLISMTLLGSAAGHAGGTRFVFCDLDAYSLSTIAEDARKLGLPENRLRLVEGDGIAEINWQLASLPEEEASATFLHADPYQLLAAGEDGATSVDLFGRAAALGVKCMLWYGFDSVRDRDDLRLVLRSLADVSPGGGNEKHRPPWYGEVSLGADDLSEVGFDRGVLGCGVVLCNVGEEALAACERLGEGLSRIYTDTSLPNGADGSLAFECGWL
jgi:23S rRNA (adenine2030-N6)-methyltransferase